MMNRMIRRLRFIRPTAPSTSPKTPTPSKTQAPPYLHQVEPYHKRLRIMMNPYKKNQMRQSLSRQRRKRLRNRRRRRRSRRSWPRKKRKKRKKRKRKMRRTRLKRKRRKRKKKKKKRRKERTNLRGRSTCCRISWMMIRRRRRRISLIIFILRTPRKVYLPWPIRISSKKPKVKQPVT